MLRQMKNEIIDYLDGKSYLMYKFHHQLSDGISFLNYIIAHAKEDERNLLPLQKPGIYIKIIGYLISPIMIIFQIVHLLKQTQYTSKNKNIIQGVKSTGYKQVYQRDEGYDLSKIKAISKKVKMTFTDFLLTVFSKALYAFCKEKYNEDIPHIVIILPVSFRGQAKNPSVIKLTNDISAFFMNIPLKQLCDGKENQNLNKQIKKFSDHLNQFKSKMFFFSIIASQIMLQITNQIFPRIIIKHLNLQVQNKGTVLFSCVPGIQNQVHYLDYIIEDFLTPVNNFGNIALTCQIFSYNEKFYLTLHSDKSVKFDLKAFNQKFDQILEEEFFKLNQ